MPRERSAEELAQLFDGLWSSDAGLIRRWSNEDGVEELSIEYPLEPPGDKDECAAVQLVTMAGEGLVLLLHTINDASGGCSVSEALEVRTDDLRAAVAKVLRLCDHSDAAAKGASARRVRWALPMRNRDEP